MIVVDTNIITYLYLPTALTSQAEQLRLSDPDWLAPVLWRSEFRNLLTGYARRSALSFEAARQIQGEAERMMAGREYQPASAQVLDLASTCECSAYDCEFAALALDLGADLVTMDRQLLRAFPRFARPLPPA